MATADEVVVEFEARVAGYERDLKRAQRTFETTTGAQQARMAQFERRVSAGAGRIGAALAGIATVATAREFLRITDSAKQLEAQLRLATRESGNFAQAQDDVRRIAAGTRSGLEETAQLYATFQRNAQELGITQEQSARATETVTKAFQISGATAAEAAGGLRQFLQGLQSGALRGEELNSVLENAPRLAKLLADSLGVTIGQLRAMGQEGDLAADKLIDALTNQKFTAGIDAEFRELPVTFDQAMTQVYNAAVITFGAFDRGGEFSSALANFVTDGTSGFEDLEQSAIETGIDIRSTFEGLSDAFDPLLDAAREIFSLIESDATSLADRVRPILGEIDAITNFVSFGNGTNLLGRFNEGQSRSESARRAALAKQDAADQITRVAPPRPRSTGGGGGAATRKPRGSRGASAESLARKAEQERLSAIREEASKSQDMAQLQDDILAARAALATAADDILRFELQQLDSDKVQRLAQYQTEVKLGQLTQDEYNRRAGLIEEETDLRRQNIERLHNEDVAKRQQEAQREALRQQNDQLALESDALQSRADIADTLEQRRFLENSALAIQQEIERSLLEQAIAEGRIADAAAARAALAGRQSAETIGLEKANQGALGRYADSTKDPKARAEEAAVRELENVRDGLAEGLADQLGAKNQFVKDLFSIFLDEVIFGPLAEALSKSSGGGAGGLFSAIGTAIGSIFGGGRAIGGPVKAGVPYLVGEAGGRGEMFVPQQAGVIVPNHRLTAPGGSSSTQIIQVDARGAVMNDQFASMILNRAKGYAAEAGAASYKKSMQDAPAAISKKQRYG